ncbi:MAG: hypothetical protein O3B95_01460, partial [Chloroflexi bacterium]|nr:hypothetical protein [Chloroflexota bacterium]
QTRRREGDGRDVPQRDAEPDYRRGLVRAGRATNIATDSGVEFGGGVAGSPPGLSGMHERCVHACEYFDRHCPTGFVFTYRLLQLALR